MLKILKKYILGLHINKCIVMGNVISVNFGNNTSRGVISNISATKELVPYKPGSLTVVPDYETKYFNSKSPTVRLYDTLESIKTHFESKNNIQIARELYDEAVKSIVDDLTYCDLYYRKQKIQPSLRKALMKQRIQVSRTKCMRILEQKF